MLIKNQDEVFARVAVIFAEFVNLPDGVGKNRFVQPVRSMGVWWLVLVPSHIEDKAVKFFDCVEQAVREMPELSVRIDIPDCVKTRSLLFPRCRVLLGALDLPCKKVTLTLEEPGCKTPYVLGGQDKTRQAEHWALLIFWVFPADVRADVAEFIQVDKIGHRREPRKKTRRPALKHGPRKEGKFMALYVHGLRLNYQFGQLPRRCQDLDPRDSHLLD